MTVIFCDNGKFEAQVPKTTTISLENFLKIKIIKAILVYLYRSYMYHIPQLFLQTSSTYTLLCNHAKTQTHVNTQISTSACRQLLLQIQPIPFCCHNAFKSFINHPILRIRHFLTKTIRTYSYLIHEGSDHQNFAYDFEDIEFST